MHVPRVAGEQRTSGGIAFGDDGRRRAAARQAEHPFDKGGDRQDAATVREVSKGEARDLERVRQRHVLEQVEADALRCDLEAAVPSPVPGDVRRLLDPDRQRRRRPQGAAVEIVDVENLTGAIADRIVGPGGELVVAAVLRPGIAAAFGGDLEAEGGIGDDIDPRRRRRLSGSQHGNVLATIR